MAGEIGGLMGLILNQFRTYGLNPELTMQGGIANIVIKGEDVKRMIEESLPPQLKQFVEVEAGDIVVKVKLI